MKIVCAWHPKFFGRVLVMGEKEPLDNKETTDVICPECYDLMMFEQDICDIERETKGLRRAVWLLNYAITYW